MNDFSIKILAELLEAKTGQQLSINRHWRIGTALSGLFRERGISTLEQLIALLIQSRDRSLAREVVEALLNNETYFFRDRAMFDLLSQRILPELAKSRESTRHLSIWSAGCSTGQEALSVAMMFAERALNWGSWSIDIYGTDVSESVIEVARKGSYTQFEIQRGLGVVQMVQWFGETPDGWQAQEKLRRMVRFDVHNMLDPLPKPTKFDIVLCRNVLLYFDAAHRARAFDRLAEAMAPVGWLMLGAGETVIGQTNRLVPDPECAGLYRQASPGASSSSAIRHRNRTG